MYTKLEIEDYRDTVGKTRSFAEEHNHQQPGDPARLAKALLELADLPDPPVRLQLGSDAVVIDSAEATAEAAATALAARVLPATPATAATFECFATDSVEKFQRLGSLFLRRPIAGVHHLDLGG